MDIRVKRKLAFRLATNTAGVALILAAAMSVLSVHLSLKQLQHQQKEIIGSVLGSTLPSFNLATFNYNLPLTQQLTEGLVSHPGIASAIVLDSSGLQLARAGKASQCESGTLSLLMFDDPGLHIHPLIFDGIPLGKLVVELDRCEALSEFRQQILLEVLYALSFTLLIALFLYAMFHRKITAPLTRLAQELSVINTDNLESTDLRRLISSRDDELGVLMNRFAQLLQLLREDLEKQRHSENTINEYSQKLEDLISKRTSALTSLNKRLQQSQDEPETEDTLKQRLSTLMQLLQEPLLQLIHQLDEAQPEEAKLLARQLHQLSGNLQILQEQACQQSTDLTNPERLISDIVEQFPHHSASLSYICDIRESVFIPEKCLTLLLHGLLSNCHLRRNHKPLLVHIKPDGDLLQINISGKGLSIMPTDFDVALLPLTPDTLAFPCMLGLGLLKDLSQMMQGELILSTFDLHGQTLSCRLPLKTRLQTVGALQATFRKQPLALQISDEIFRHKVLRWLTEWDIPFVEQSVDDHQILITDRKRHGHTDDLTLCLTLPERQPTEAELMQALIQLIGRQPCHERQPLRVLLVDDNTINRMLCQRYLKNLNIEPELADNGLHAIELTQRKRFDLILMDCQMPVMDGFEATRQIRRNAMNQSTPIIALTGLSGDNERQNCLAAGMNDFISKPFTQDQIQAALIQWVSQYFDHAND